MYTSDELTSLINLADGAAIELFDMELLKVLENIQNPNRQKDLEREITGQITQNGNSGLTQHEAVVVFHSGIVIFLDHSPELKLAADHHFGGSLVDHGNLGERRGSK